MEKFLKKYYKLFFLAVALFLLYPTFQKGYIFLLDWDIIMNISLADIAWKTDSIVRIISSILALIFSFGVFQRIYLFAIIFFLGLAGFCLAKKTNNIFAQYFAGLFLIFNPFIYARLIEQPGVALGSLFFFWFLMYFLESLEEKEKNNKKILLSSIFAGLAVASFAHSIFFIAISIATLLAFDYLKNRDWGFILKILLIIWAVIILLNCNYLFTLVSGSNSGISGVKNFSMSDVETFKTKTFGGYSVYYTVLAMQGYWGEYQDRFVSIQENPLWIVAFFGIFILAIFGLIRKIKNKDCCKNHHGKINK